MTVSSPTQAKLGRGEKRSPSQRSLLYPRERERERDRQTDRQTDRQIETETETETETDRQTDRQTDRECQTRYNNSKVL